MIAQERLAQIRERFEYIEAAMAQGGDDYARLAREYSELKPVVEKITSVSELEAALAGARELREDPEMRVLAEEEVAVLKPALEAAQEALTIALLPRDAADGRPAIIEIRAGTGGEEAALFAADLARMYQRYADQKGWRVELISEAETELGGYREVIFALKGENVFERMKFESGVHRVQRVPETESGGRVHTSAATVAVLPQAEEVDIAINPNDLRIDTMRASGAGGQHVNTTDSAVRITHIPTGLVVTSSEKSQHQNRAIAMEVLRARLFEMERSRQAEERASARKGQVGSGDRSERIRTYNFPQGRLSDHRINLTLYKLDQIVAGDLDEVIDALLSDHQAQLLAEATEA